MYFCEHQRKIVEEISLHTENAIYDLVLVFFIFVVHHHADDFS
jgi:hypothetical protein